MGALRNLMDPDWISGAFCITSLKSHESQELSQFGYTHEMQASGSICRFCGADSWAKTISARLLAMSSPKRAVRGERWPAAQLGAFVWSHTVEI